MQWQFICDCCRFPNRNLTAYYHSVDKADRVSLLCCRSFTRFTWGVREVPGDSSLSNRTFRRPLLLQTLELSLCLNVWLLLTFQRITNTLQLRWYIQIQLRPCGLLRVFFLLVFILWMNIIESSLIDSSIYPHSFTDYKNELTCNGT